MPKPNFSTRPAAFAVIDNRGYVTSRHATEALADKSGKSECMKDTYRTTPFVGIYKLVKIVRRKEVPLEIETVEA